MTTTTAPPAATASAAPAVAAPWWGRPAEHRHAAIVGVLSLLVCLGYRQATVAFAPDITPGLVEFAGTWTSLWCVWITQRRNVLALPIGIVSVVLMGKFFADIGLHGQTLLHWAYYVPVQAYGWWAWCRGGTGRTELPVTWLRARGRVVGVAAVVAGTVAVGWLLGASFESAVYSYWDASIVAASVVAQWALSRKHAESWWLWIGPVNVSAIGLYLLTGAYMFAALYVLFLVMAFFGLARWSSAARDGAA